MALAVDTAAGVEGRRLTLQADLDAEKSQSARNKLGQFATPTRLALDILRYARDLVPEGEPVRFLDPAIGTGSFYSALRAAFADDVIAAAEGYEIDPHYGVPARELWADTPLRIHLEDFTRATPPPPDEQANLLICNPPYVRHHHLSAEQKRWLGDAAQRVTGRRPSGLAGLYAFFLLVCHDWMADGGVAGWLIPSEFMDVNYGAAVKDYLLNQVTLLHIHRADPNEVEFDDALVSSAIVWFRKESPPADHTVEFSYGGALHTPRESVRVPAETLRHTRKWTRFPSAHADDAAETKGGTTTRLADLFRIQRGLATGNNDYFILTPEQIAEHDLPERFLVPILPSARYVPTDEILADKDGQPLVDRRLFLLSPDVPEEVIRDRYPTLWAYLEKGRKQKIHETYLCAHRKVWYQQEKRPAPPILCTYLGRQDNANGRPFRFVLNHSQATASNVWLLLYPKPALAAAMEKDPALLRRVWQALNKISAATLLSEGRVYGGGLNKLEPKELANAPADAIAALVPEVQRPLGG